MNFLADCINFNSFLRSISFILYISILMIFIKNLTLGECYLVHMGGIFHNSYTPITYIQILSNDQ